VRGMAVAVMNRVRRAIKGPNTKIGEVRPSVLREVKQTLKREEKRAKARAEKDPCEKCPLSDRTVVMPVVPDTALLIVAGLAPGGVEVDVGEPFRGPSGKVLRKALSMAGLDPEVEVGYVNVTRCRPPGDVFNADWKKAARLCRPFFVQDIIEAGKTPLLSVGTDSLQALLEDRRATVGKYRGLWWNTPDGRNVFSTWHPSAVLRNGGIAKPMGKQFVGDLKKMADKVLGKEDEEKVKIRIYEDPGKAAKLLKWLSTIGRPWAFDIETYDVESGDGVPSRREVATDPCHDDFRVRGVAIAWSPTKGAWIEFMPWENNKAKRQRARRLLSNAFGSPDPKWAFNGSFDEEGLIMQDWVECINNRNGDGLLGLISLDDGRRTDNTLKRATAEVLRKPTYWEIDKALMASQPLAIVADGGVRDAMGTFELVRLLHRRLRGGRYFKYGKG